MDNSLTKLHEQFQRKHHELAEITGKIDSFMQAYKPKVDARKTVRGKIKALRDGLRSIKEEFAVVRKDLLTYGQLPNDFVKMVVELPAIYEAFWEHREELLKRELSVKDEENSLLKQKILQKDAQILQLRRRQQTKPAIPKYPAEPQPKKQIKGGQKQMNEQQDLDDYINNMEITIRENDDLLFKKITEQCSQEEEEEESSDYSMQQDRRNNTARSNALLDCSDEALKLDQLRKKSESSFLQENREHCRNKGRPRAEEMVNKHVFWNKLSKNLGSKTKSKKSLSQSKENIESKSMNKLTVAEKRVLTSKITDFRRLLFVEKGFQRLAFRLD